MMRDYLPSWNGWPFVLARERSFGVQADCGRLGGPPKATANAAALGSSTFGGLADDRILLLDIYAKAEQEDLAADEIKKLKRKIMP